MAVSKWRQWAGRLTEVKPLLHNIENLELSEINEMFTIKRSEIGQWAQLMPLRKMALFSSENTEIGKAITEKIYRVLAVQGIPDLPLAGDIFLGRRLLICLEGYAKPATPLELMSDRELHHHLVCWGHSSSCVGLPFQVDQYAAWFNKMPYLRILRLCPDFHFPVITGILSAVGSPAISNEKKTVHHTIACLQFFDQENQRERLRDLLEQLLLVDLCPHIDFRGLLTKSLDPRSPLYLKIPKSIVELFEEIVLQRFEVMNKDPAEKKKGDLAESKKPSAALKKKR